VSGNTARAQAGDDTATALGGGVVVANAAEASRIVNSTVTENAARAFAALAGGDAVAAAEGGGLSATVTTVNLTNATVARNAVGGEGALTFIRGGGVVSSTSTIRLRGTIVALNAGPSDKDCGGPLASLGHNLIGTTAGCTFAATPSDKRNRPAKLGTFGAHGGPTRTIPLLKSSPALNAIPKAACTVKADQRGVKRPKQHRCEIGAYERKPQ
jgi:hypothetical protein